MFWINEFELVHWAYWQRETLRFERHLIGLFGPNGSGKTTYLDAVRTAFGIECAGTERDYRHYLRPHKEEVNFAWLRAVVRNDPYEGQRPFRRASSLVTVFCRMRRASQGWQREYLIADGEREIDWANDNPKVGWLTLRQFNEQLEMAGLTKEMKNVLRLPQEETSRLASMKPPKLLELLLDVRGDKNAIDNWKLARENQNETRKHLDRLDAQKELAEAHLRNVSAQAESYRRYERLSAERLGIQAERLPQARYREHLQSYQYTRNLVRNDINELRTLRQEWEQESGSLVILAVQHERAQTEFETAAEHSSTASIRFGTCESNLRHCKGVLDERDRLRLLMRQEASDSDPVAERAKVQEQTKLLSTEQADLRARAVVIAADLAAMPHGEPAKPRDVLAFRAALDEIGIQYRMLPEVLAVEDERWSAALEGVLAPYRHIVLLARDRDERRAMEVGERLQYRHYVVPRLVEAHPARSGSLLEKITVNGRVPRWLLAELNNIQCVESVADGQSLGPDVEWITPRAYHRNSRGGRSRVVGEGYFSAKAREEHRRALQAESRRLADEILALDRRLLHLEKENNRLVKLINGLNAARMLEANSERYSQAETDLPALKQAFQDATVTLTAAKTTASEAQGELQQVTQDQQRARSSLEGLDRRIAEYRKAFRSKRDSQRTAIRAMRVMRNSAAAHLLTPERLAQQLNPNETVALLEVRLRQLDQEVAGDLVRDPSVLELLKLAEESLASKKALMEEKSAELEKAIQETIKARDNYMKVVRRSVDDYERAVQEIAVPAGVEIQFEKPVFSSQDNPLANTGLSVRASFHGKEIDADDGIANLSGGQRVVVSMILLLALLGKSRPHSMFFIDEPFAHLDSVNVELVADFLFNTPGQFLITIPEREHADVFQRLGVAYFTRLKERGRKWAPRIGFVERAVERRAA